MSEKVLLVSDSTTDLNSELIERYGIKILPLGVTLGEELYSDGVDIDPDRIYEFYEKNGELPKTSAVNISNKKVQGLPYPPGCRSPFSYFSS